MNNANKEVESLTVRPACLSDMATILEVYKENLSANQKSTAHPSITTDLGLPINVFLNGDEIVGYSFVTMENSGAGELQYRFSAAGNFTKINDELLRASLDKTQPADQLADSVSRLVKWLNHCY